MPARGASLDWPGFVELAVLIFAGITNSWVAGQSTRNGNLLLDRPVTVSGTYVAAGHSLSPESITDGIRTHQTSKGGCE